MIRTQEATGKTVDEARTNACALLGVEKDDINVSYEVLEMPRRPVSGPEAHSRQGPRQRRAAGRACGSSCCPR